MLTSERTYERPERLSEDELLKLAWKHESGDVVKIVIGAKGRTLTDWISFGGQQPQCFRCRSYDSLSLERWFANSRKGAKSQICAACGNVSTPD